MKKFLTTFGIILFFISCKTNDKSKEIELSETKQKYIDLEKKHKKLLNENSKISTKEKIKDLTISIFLLDKESLEGLIMIQNEKTEQNEKFLIELISIDKHTIKSYIEFKDLDFDGKEEILILEGVPGHKRGYKIFDYNSLKPKEIFKRNKNSIFVGTSEVKKQFTNLINVGYRSTYELDNKEKTISFGGACGASCTNIEVYQLKENIFNLTISKRIENGITTISK